MPDQTELFPKPRKHTVLRGLGYAATPGSGPAGETCKGCAHLKRREFSGRTVNKCGLNKKNWGPSTDIRLDAPSCVHWTKKAAEL